MANRCVVCPCGHPMSAADDQTLYLVVRRHTDDQHSDLGYTREQIEQLIQHEGYDCP
jgi:hypothetical protein